MLSALGSNSLAKACQTYHFNQNGQFAGIYDFKLTNYDLEVNYADVEGNILFEEYLDNGSDVDEHGYITTINKGKKTKIAIKKR